MRIGFNGPSYTAQSSAIADEECINFFVETIESGGYGVEDSGYGGRTAHNVKSSIYTPGLKVFSQLPSGPARGDIEVNGRLFAVADTQLYEVFADGTFTARGYIYSDGDPVSFSFNAIQLMIVGGKHAYCYTLATDDLLDITDKLAGVPIRCDCSDTYFIVFFQDSNKFQLSQVLDGTTWPGQLVNEVSVFPDNITSIIVNHRELWVFGSKRSQPYQDTGSANVFDVIEGALLEVGNVSPMGPCRVDNSIFWIGKDERGALIAWRNNGYTPSRISTHAVEIWLSQQARVSELVSYSYQDRGHLFWVLYVPDSDCNWVFDVGENMWHKRAAWVNGVWQSHWSWNHVYAFGKNLVGDWNSGNLYEMTFSAYDDNGTEIRRVRRAPTVSKERDWIRHVDLIVDFETGMAPQPPLQDGDGNDRQPQAMLRWSDDRGKTWSNQHTRDCGFAGQYNVPVHWMRLGRSRNRVYELTVTDPIPWVITDAYLRVA